MENKSFQRNVLLVAALSNFLTPFMGSSVIVSLPRIARDLSMNVATLSWVSTAFLLAAAAFLIPFGRISDIYGRKKVFLWGVALYSLSSVLGACASSSATLIAARVFQGIGGAMSFTMAVAIITSAFPVSERGKALGIAVAAVYAGLSAGPFIGGFLTQHFGWRSVFLANVPIGAFMFTVTFRKLEGEWTEAKGEKLDGTGFLILIVSLPMMMYGLSTIPQASALLLVVLGIAGTALFVAWETRVDSPLLDMRLFRESRTFLLSNLAVLINYSATFAVTFLISLYLQYIKGLDPQAAGIVLVAQPLTQVVFSPLAGRLSDRVEPGIVASVGMALTAVGLSFFVFIGEATGLVFLVLNLVLLGLGFALFASPNTNAIMSSVGKKHFGVASGTLAAMRVMGQMFSMGIVMVTLSLSSLSGVIITPRYHGAFLHSTRTAFAVSALICFAGIFPSLGRGKRGSPDASPPG